MALKKNRVILVTGASRGVGKGVALGIAEKGDTVIITGRSLNKGTSVTVSYTHLTLPTKA